MLGQDQTFMQEIEITPSDVSASTYMGAGYRHALFLEKGFEWEVVAAYLTADTTYSSTTNNYNYNLCDSSGNTICTVNTGSVKADFSASDTTAAASYKNIDTSSAASNLYVVGAISGTGHVVRGLKMVVRLKRKRAAS